MTQYIALMIDSPQVFLCFLFCVFVAGVLCHSLAAGQQAGPALLRRVVFLTAAGLLSICGGCKLASSLNPLPEGEPKMTEQELLLQLRSYLIRTVRVADDVADRVIENSSERRERFLMLKWKIGLDRELRGLLDSRTPLRALFEMWVQVDRAVDFVDTPEGKELFGEHAETLGNFYASAELGLQEIAKHVFDTEQFDVTRARVEKLAEEHPLKIGDVRSATMNLALSEADGDSLASIVSAPTKFIAYATGVDDTARAIDTVSASADRIAFLVAGIPQSTRWEIERLLFAVDENETTKSLLADANAISQTAKKLGETVEALPERLQQEVSKTLDQVDAKQANLRQTISRADDVVKNIDAALVKASTTLQDFERSARALEAAGKAVEPVMREISKLAGVDEVPKGDPSPDPAKGAENPDGGRPFDILDYAKTSDALTRAATELRTVLAELNALTGGDHLPNALEKMSRSADVTIENTGKQAQDLVDHVFWRAVQLVVVLLVAFVVYRWIATRIKVPATG